MSILHQSRTSRELAEIKANMEEMQRQINILVSHIAALPQPPRPKWERHSMPKWEDTYSNLPTMILPSATRENTAPPVTRVTACRSGNQVFVTAYNGDERVMEGTSRQIGSKLVKWYPDLKWEVVAESA